MARVGVFEVPATSEFDALEDCKLGFKLAGHLAGIVVSRQGLLDSNNVPGAPYNHGNHMRGQMWDRAACGSPGNGMMRSSQVLLSPRTGCVDEEARESWCERAAQIAELWQDKGLEPDPKSLDT